MRGLCLILGLLAAGCVTEEKKERTFIYPDESTVKGGKSVLDAEIQRCEKRARQFPDRPEYRQRLAKLLFRRERFGEAIDAIEDAIERDPTNPSFHYTLGSFYYRMGKYDLAETSFRKMLEHTAPGRYTGPHAALGLVLAAQGEVDEAIEQYRKCVEIDPDFAEAYYFLGSLHDMRNEPERTIQYYERYLAYEGGRYRRAAEKRLAQLRRKAAPLPASAPPRLP